MTSLRVLEDEPERHVRWRRFFFGFVVACLLQGGGLFGAYRMEAPQKSRRKPVVVRLVRSKPKPKPKVVVQKPPEVKKKPKPKPKPKPKKKRKKRKKRKRKPKPKPKPKPKAQQPQKPPKKPPKKPPPLITGLTLKSTVKGGKGLAVQVGNTMYGKPKSKLTEPVTDKAAPGARTQEGSPVEVYTPPRVIRKIIPKYTAEALSEGIEGTITLVVYIDKRGKLTRSRMINKLGFGLDEAAVRTVRLWTFAPATRGGRPVAGRKTVKVQFVIE